MGFQIFPKRTNEERRDESREALIGAGLFGVIALSGVGLVLLTNYLDPATGSWWWTAGYVGVIAAFAGFFLLLQSVLALTIAATIGMERAMAVFAALVIAGGLLAWLGYD